MPEIAPQKRHGRQWAHYGCVECGEVFYLPINGNAEAWCGHGNRSYVWIPPGEAGDDLRQAYTDTTYGGQAWSLTIPVKVSY